MPAKICVLDKKKAKETTLKAIGSYAQLIEKFKKPLDLLQEITGCCKQIACGKDNKGDCKLLDLSGDLKANGQIGGPFFLAQTLIETLYLEKAEGFSKDKVAWGKLTNEAITELDAIHVTSHYLRHRLPYFAQMQGSNLAALIVASLREAVEEKGGPKFTLLVGHDSNIGALFGLNWQPETYAKNQVPPASGLVFELYYDPLNKAHSVKTYFISQTLDQMAHLQLASEGALLMWVPVKNAKCQTQASGCPYEEWEALIKKELNFDCVSKQLRELI